ncbi:hypothetical protein [Bradyrhizobium sp. 6(2017)]|uniref:hypothetical protein n=1 Tax=Bradyrhizobium sp. 6(2017) TaxID=1197460 RepID=UPI0013E1A7F5|nr:hypothetical protein [Bradyrhizobium sp. 6(2017)]QIG95504.1 hypothetical protein G6P99_25945 [Bradyrhizobium sp. 6(2017)]
MDREHIVVNRSKFTQLTLTASILLLSILTTTGHAQKFPSCVDAAATQKSKLVLARFIEQSAQAGPDFKVVSVDIEKIWPRTARFGNYSGILECEVTARITVMKISTGQRLVMGLDKFVLYYAYDQNGELVVETP